MKSAVVGGYRRARRGVAVAGMAATMIGIAAGGALAGSYGDSTKIGADDYDYAASTYAVTYKDHVYQYATAKDGSAYYTTYDGEEWSSWQSWDNQPVKYKWDPAPTNYKDDTYVYYTGEDDYVYYASYDGSEWSDWQSLNATAVDSAPYAYSSGDYTYVYATGKDGYVYYKSYDGAEWSDWQNVSGESKAKYEPYAVSYDGYENVFWYGEDKKVYWNRYDGKEWTGEKAIPGDYEFQYAPYAAEYDGKLYAYSSTSEGYPAWASFDGDKWSDWSTYDGVKVKYQPNAYYDETAKKVIVAYTGDDDHAYYAEYDGSWGDWQDAGDNYDYDPYQYSYDGDTYLTYTGKNGDPYYKTYSGDDGGY